MKTKLSSNNLRSDQQGFSPVEAVLVVVTILIFVLVGWYVYKANNHKITSTSSTLSHSSSSKSSNMVNSQDVSTFTDSSNAYSLNYPKSWKQSQQQQTDSIQAFTLLDPNQVGFTPPGAPDVSTVKSAGTAVANAVWVLGYNTGNTKAVLSDYMTGNGHSPVKDLTINGYSAMYQQSTSTSAPTYTDDVYAVTHNDVTLVLTFREKQGTDSSGTPSFNATNTVPAFTSIVKSVKFLN